MKTIAFNTFGCKLNFSETASISRQFDTSEYAIVGFKEHADYYIIHSCTVTANAESKTISAIKQAIKRNPSANVIVIGCMAELDSEKLSKINGVKILLGNSEKFRLQEYIQESINESENSDRDLNTFIPSWSVHERSRSFVKIQDGCDYFCSYCTIPYARGRSRSGKIYDLLKIFEDIANQNIKEVVLTGVNIGDFGKHNNENLYQLLRQIEKIEGLERIRISSIEPDLLDDRIIDMAAERGKLLPHFHISLQSGSDKILRLMKRKYSINFFREKVEKIKKSLPEACIASDIIAGYPGETESDFKDTLDFLSNLAISYLHIFPYSSRQGTISAKSGENLSKSLKRERCLRLQQLSDIKKKEFYSSNLGKTAKVLFEGENKTNYICGFTENYIRVRHPFRTELVNAILKVKLTDINEKGIFETEVI